MTNIIAITNSNGVKESSWKMPLTIFSSASVYLPVGYSISQFFMSLVMEFSWIFCTFYGIEQVCGAIL